MTIQNVQFFWVCCFLKTTKLQLNNNQMVVNENILIPLRLGCVECLERL